MPLEWKPVDGMTPTPETRGVPLSASPEIRAAAARALASPPPMTDAELDAIGKRNQEPESSEEFAGWGFPAIGRLVAEVRRLRGDEWIEAAAEEISQAHDPINEAAGIIRKHRDGRA